jgi:hypothetical protein
MNSLDQIGAAIYLFLLGVTLGIFLLAILGSKCSPTCQGEKMYFRRMAGHWWKEFQELEAENLEIKKAIADGETWKLGIDYRSEEDIEDI